MTRMCPRERFWFQPRHVAVNDRGNSLSRTLPAFSHEFQTQADSHRLVAAAWDSSSPGPAERSGSVVGLQTSERVSRRSRVVLLYACIICTHTYQRVFPCVFQSACELESARGISRANEAPLFLFLLPRTNISLSLSRDESSDSCGNVCRGCARLIVEKAAR